MRHPPTPKCRGRLRLDCPLVPAIGSEWVPIKSLQVDSQGGYTVAGDRLKYKAVKAIAEWVHRHYGRDCPDDLVSAIVAGRFSIKKHFFLETEDERETGHTDAD